MNIFTYNIEHIFLNIFTYIYYNIIYEYIYKQIYLFDACIHSGYPERFVGVTRCQEKLQMSLHLLKNNTKFAIYTNYNMEILLRVSQ